MNIKFEPLITWVENIKERNHSSAAALVIIKDNEIVLEHYSGYHSNTDLARKVTAESQFNVASARKSYLGLAVAYALYEGKIKSLDDHAAHYMDDVDHDLLGNSTIRHFVTHSHGLHQKEDGTIYREFEPGENWAYRGINVLLISRLIEKLYGKSFPELLKERVFLPLGWDQTGWHTEDTDELVKVIIDPEQKGTDKLGDSKDGSQSNLYVSAREFAYWGNLHLNHGNVNGRKIVPSEVIHLATQIQSPWFKDKELPHNGIFWYVKAEPAARSEIGDRVPKGAYQILGITGPAILVIPEYNAVVAKMYNKRYNYGGENYLHYLREFSNIVSDTFKKV
ncbi:CubicO group peptidase (beta-lactamase class C family) [Peribacillus deserti]|uniref:CubicO group peptidase (Beta-lactamase class C family) n=1 Tax=Peribacillus deserti TaxID=673318 RepID=A0ABS2QD58_9BACI|nr:serine hydrolase [Peribacillus deserti]MBM7691096.1 CubicO group peptidase (beta-lactamase class C family) [Peribacillus deserti]